MNRVSLIRTYRETEQSRAAWIYPPGLETKVTRRTNSSESNTAVI